MSTTATTDSSRRVVHALLVSERPGAGRSLERLAAETGQLDLLVTSGVPALLRHGQPDVVLIDLDRVGPLQQGILRWLRTLPQPPPFIALVSEQDDSRLIQAVTLGASALLAVDTPPEFILSTMRRITQGEQPIQFSLLRSPAATNFLLQRLRDLLPPEETTESCPLSRRELDVLKRVAQGFSNKEIANDLGLQEQTIKNCVSTILKKMRANHRAQAAVVAVRNGWISLEENKPRR